MYNILIIGAGNLGSRHLQGALKSNHSIKLTVFDPNEKSILLAKTRSDEISHKHEIFFTSIFSDLADEYFLAIIATNSDVREKVLNELIEISKISYLVLEKVLFQNINSYHNVSNVLISKNIRTWVNHPRRMSNSYNWLKNELHSENSCSISVYGNNWGMACNSIHFLDLISFLFETNIRLINSDLLHNQIINSKRDGFIEFNGSIYGLLDNNSNFQISCNKHELNSGVSISISTPKYNYLIHEGHNGKILKYQDANLVQEVQMDINYQSDLTTTFVNEIIEFGNTMLTSFDESKNLHIKYVAALLQKYNYITNLNSTNLPIT